MARNFVWQCEWWIKTLYREIGTIGLPGMSAGGISAQDRGSASFLNDMLGHINQLFFLMIMGVLLVISIFAVLAVVISLLNYEENPVRDRLKAFKEKGTFEKTERRAGAFDDLSESLIVLSGPMGQRLYGGSQKQVRSLLTEAGLPDSDEHAARFLAKRAAVGLVCAVIGVIAAAVVAPQFLAVSMLGGFILGSMLPRFALINQGKKRKNEIRFGLPDTLDLMVVLN